jgi:hypothetical protein
VSEVAWVVLLVLSALLAINHVVGAILRPGPTAGVFVTPASANLAAVVLLLLPYRRGRAWAWWAVWGEVTVTASVPFWTRPEVGLWYGGTAAVLAVGQLIALRRFRSEP